MVHEQISIRTADGNCPTHVFMSGGESSSPAVIIYMTHSACGLRCWM